MSQAHEAPVHTPSGLLKHRLQKAISEYIEIQTTIPVDPEIAKHEAALSVVSTEVARKSINAAIKRCRESDAGKVQKARREALSECARMFDDAMIANGRAVRGPRQAKSETSEPVSE